MPGGGPLVVAKKPTKAAPAKKAAPSRAKPSASTDMPMTPPQGMPMMGAMGGGKGGQMPRKGTGTGQQRRTGRGGK